MKIIFRTVLVTITIIFITLWLFLNSILGMFGMVATSVSNMRDLNTSKEVVQKIKSRHKYKNRNLKNKLAKKAGKRMASTTSAAAIPVAGTVAVVITTSYFITLEYCNQKKELQEDSNILYGTTEVFGFEQCMRELTNYSVESISEVFSESSKYSAEKLDIFNKSIIDTWQTTSLASEDYWEKIIKFWREQQTKLKTKKK